MKQQMTRLKRTLRELTKLCEAEAAGIRRRAFAQLQRLSQTKQSLLADLETALAEISAGDVSVEVVQELEHLRDKASENARGFEALRTGAADARERIRELREKKSKTGLYGAGGDAIKAPGPATVIRDF